MKNNVRRYIFNAARRLFWKNYDPNEDFTCVNCGKEMFGRTLFCSEKCGNEFFNRDYKMSPGQIADLSVDMVWKNPWMNLKNGDIYSVECARMDCTNAREGIPVICYRSLSFDTCEFVRDYVEFVRKFKPYAEINKI